MGRAKKASGKAARKGPGRKARRRRLGRAPSGVPGFDEVLHGGVPARTITLVAGGTGCGKSVLGLEFLVHGAAERDEPGLIVSFEEPAERIRAVCRAFGWPVRALERAGKLAIFDLSTGPQVHQVGRLELDPILVGVRAEAARIGARRLVLDSLDGLFHAFARPEEVRGALIQLMRGLQGLGLTALLLAETPELASRYGSTLTRWGVEEFVADAVLQIHRSPGERFARRFLEVVKIRGGDFEAGRHLLEINSRGIHIFPFCRTLARPATRERISTGVEGIDAWTGGLLRDSNLLVSGNPGTGKTVLGLHFVGAGCRAGERCLLISTEEAPDHLRQTGEALGLPLRRHERKGLLRIESFCPASSTLGRHVLRVSRWIREHRPRRVVIDSISAMEEIATSGDLVEFAYHLTGEAQGHAVTLLMTYAIRQILGPSFRLAEAPISSFADAIFVLRQAEVAGRLLRTLSILKMRNTAFEARIWPFEIGRCGIELAPPETLAAGAPRRTDPRTGAPSGAAEGVDPPR